jgi:hypothetical protein
MSDTFCSQLSAVFKKFRALSMFPSAAPTPRNCRRNVSEIANPAGSSAALWMRTPDDKREVAALRAESERE